MALDAAADYTRSHFGTIFPRYLLAMIPLSSAFYYLIDCITSGNRSAYPAASLFITLALPWRWYGIAALQRQIQDDLRGEPPAPLLRRIAPILLAKLIALVAMTWGAPLIVPLIFGIFFSGLAAPMLLEMPGHYLVHFQTLGAWILGSNDRLIRILLAMAVLTLLCVLSVFILQYLVLSIIVARVIGINISDLQLTLASTAWILSIGYFIWIIVDVYWTVASIMVFYDLQTRRLGSDLRLKLRQINGVQLP